MDKNSKNKEPKDQMKERNELRDDNLDNINNHTSQPGSILSQKDKIIKLMMMIKQSTMMKIIKEDNIPIELIKGLFIGSFASSLNKKALNENGITHIVVCGISLKQYYPNELQYIQLNLLDAETENIKQYFIEAGAFIYSALKSNGKVLVHCHAGISRSSAIVLSYLIKYNQMRLNDALALVKSKRDKINPNAGFIKQLKEYEQECFN